jgi:hypothetical protein
MIKYIFNLDKFKFSNLSTKINHKKFSYNLREDPDDVDGDYTISKGAKEAVDRHEKWKKKQAEESEAVLKRAHEMVRKRMEEAKRNNKEFLLKMKVPGVAEEPEK